MLLAGNISLAGFALGIERVEILLQLLFRALTGVYGTTDPAHQLTPKNRGPDQCAPVMWRAMADSDRQALPSITYLPSITSTW